MTIVATGPGHVLGSRPLMAEHPLVDELHKMIAAQLSNASRVASMAADGVARLHARVLKLEQAALLVPKRSKRHR